MKRHLNQVVRQRSLQWGRGLRLALSAALGVLLLAGLACSEDDAGSSGVAGSRSAVRVEAALGEEADLGGVRVTVSMLAPTNRPVLPDEPAESGVPARLGEGLVFHQARLIVRNQGEQAVRVDPSDFTLRAGERILYLDPQRSGPSARTLLPGASLYVLLTFPGPQDLEPELDYRPVWFNGSLTVKGSARPSGLTAAAAGT